MFVKLARAVGNGRRNVLMGPAIGEHQCICMIKHAANKLSYCAGRRCGRSSPGDVLGDVHVHVHRATQGEADTMATADMRQIWREKNHFMVLQDRCSPLWKTAPNGFITVATSVCCPLQTAPFILWRLTLLNCILFY